MCRKRPSTSKTLLACTVVNTRWPVRADCTAICAVSGSRISPTMILSGSWRRIERRPRAKVKPFLLVDRDLHHPLELVLDRILDGDELLLLVVDLGQGRIQGGGLAAAGRPGDQHHPVGFADHPPEADLFPFVDAEHVEGQAVQILGDALLVEDTDDGILAVDARHDRNAEVDRLARPCAP